MSGSAVPFTSTKLPDPETRDEFCEALKAYCKLFDGRLTADTMVLSPTSAKAAAEMLHCKIEELPGQELFGCWVGLGPEFRLLTAYPQSYEKKPE